MTIFMGVVVGFVAWLLVRYLVAGIYTVNQNEPAVKTSFGRAERVGSATISAAPIAEHLTAEEKERYNFPQVRVIPPGGPYFKWPWERVFKVLVGDIGVHMLDMVRWMLGLGAPGRVSSAGSLFAPPAKVNISAAQTATFDYGDLQVVWTHRYWGATPDPRHPWGATLYGDKGTLKASVYGYDFEPLGGGGAVHRDVKLELDEFPEDRTEKDLEPFAVPAVRRHMKDLLAARESRGRPVADIEEGAISTTACILANIAMKLGRTLEWDAGKGVVVGDEPANALLRRPYRAPWVPPEP